MDNTNNIKIALERIKLAKERKKYFLDLSHLRLNEIPEDISDMDFLMEIDLSYNFISIFPEMIVKMKNLHTIDISHNHLISIDFIYGEFYLLSKLDISHNFLSDIPNSLFYFNSEIEIRYEDNPFLDNLPFELRDYKLEMVKSYIDLVKKPENVEKLYETKLIFVGKGEVGKTTLIKTLLDKNFITEVGNEPATHGIGINQSNFDVFFPAKEPHCSHITEIDNLHRYIITIKDKDSEDWIDEVETYDRNGEQYFENVSYYLYETDPFDLVGLYSTEDFGESYYISKKVATNIWDFGGQEIYYSTHQFFLTKRSIYIFVWEPRKDDNEADFEYWLNTIKLLSQESPVLVVMNKSDIRYIPINEREYLSSYPNIKSFHQISCITRDGINDLEHAIIDCIKNLPHLGSILPKSWLNVRTSLHNYDKDFISYTSFRKVCNENNISNNQEIELLSDYLHDVGDIIHFKRDGSLKNLVIIDPKWATKAVYELIYNIPIQKQNGIFQYSDLENYLDLDRYPIETHHQLLQLMEKFSICFKVVGEQHLYIIPELLKDQIPDEKQINSIIEDDCLRFKISFNFMPKGLISKLICRLYFLLNTNNYWKNGVVFSQDSSLALILNNNIQKSLDIFISGNVKRDLFALIKFELSQVLNELNLKEDIDYFEKIPCKCDYCINGKPHYFKYSVLKRFLLHGKNVVDCEISVLPVNINELVDLYKTINKETKIIHQILPALSQLQGLSQNIGKDENSRNKFVTTYLSNKGLIAKDQSQWGLSATGKNPGELDLIIENDKGELLTIFEGVNLKSLNARTLNEHILKTILKYDVNGLPEKYLGVYYTGKSFVNFTGKYFKYLESFSNEGITFCDIFDETKELTPYSELRILRSFYRKSDRKMAIIHILVNIL
jgi:hypothetical protein